MKKQEDTTVPPRQPEHRITVKGREDLERIVSEQTRILGKTTKIKGENHETSYTEIRILKEGPGAEGLYATIVTPEKKEETGPDYNYLLHEPIYTTHIDEADTTKGAIKSFREL